MAEETLELITIEPVINLVEVERETVELGTLQSEISTPGAAISVEGLGYSYNRLFTAIITENQQIPPSTLTLLTLRDIKSWGDSKPVRFSNAVNLTQWVRDCQDCTWDLFGSVVCSTDPSEDRTATILVQTYIPSPTNDFDVFLETRVGIVKNVAASRSGVTVVDPWRINWLVVLDPELTHIARIYFTQNSPIQLTVLSGELTFAARKLAP